MRTKATQAQTSPSGLRSARLAANLSLNAAAKAAQIDPAHLSRVERGQKQLSVAALQRLAIVLGLLDVHAALSRVSDWPSEPVQ